MWTKLTVGYNQILGRNLGSVYTIAASLIVGRTKDLSIELLSSRVFQSTRMWSWW